MNKSSQKLEQISRQCDSHISFYKYNSQNTLSDKNKKGRVDASLWLNEMIYFFLNKEKNFLHDFDEEIKRQKVKVNNVKNPNYKQGLIDELSIIQELIHDRDFN